METTQKHQKHAVGLGQGKSIEFVAEPSFQHTFKITAPGVPTFYVENIANAKLLLTWMFTRKSTPTEPDTNTTKAEAKMTPKIPQYDYEVTFTDTNRPPLTVRNAIFSELNNTYIFVRDGATLFQIQPWAVQSVRNLTLLPPPETNEPTETSLPTSEEELYGLLVRLNDAAKFAAKLDSAVHPTFFKKLLHALDYDRLTGPQHQALTRWLMNR